MTTRHLVSASKVPQGTRCSHCGAKAVLQCSCCDNGVCLAHAVFFVTVACSQNALSLDAVECQSCFCGEQDELEPAQPGGD
jgi:hypothetical protein